MSKKALILHAWYNDPSKNWYPWLASELQSRDYKVSVPELPTMNTDQPDMQLQLKTVMDSTDIDTDTVVVGHSLGCLLALRLAERIKYGQMILVSGWDFDDLTEEHQSFWQDKLNHQRIRDNVAKICCISSDNDPYMTAFQVEAMSKRLGGEFVLVPGVGHFTTKDGVEELPAILNCI